MFLLHPVQRSVKAAPLSHRRQHTLPKSYLKAWCDPQTPHGQTPYVWRFSKDGTQARKKSAEKIFVENDIYTFRTPDGGRDLTLEHGLGELESRFCQVRDKSLQKRTPLTFHQRLITCAFIATMHARTKPQLEHIRSQWQQALDKMDAMTEWAKNASPEALKAAARVSMPQTEGPSIGYEEIRQIVEEPQEMVSTMVEVEVPLLMPLDFCVFSTSTVPGFITSDYPCVWYDAEAYKRPPFFQQPALIYPSIEISLPVSPRQMIVLNRKGIIGYHDADRIKRLVEELNRRTRFASREYFIVSANIKNDYWFDPGVEPEDSWRKRQEHGEVTDDLRQI